MKTTKNGEKHYSGPQELFKHASGAAAKKKELAKKVSGFVPMSKKEKEHSNKMYAHGLHMREASERQHDEEQVRLRKERKHG